MRLSSKQWNQGNLALNPFEMQRVSATHEQRIDAPALRAFQRACEAGQPGWLPGGAVQLRYSDSGHDEPNALWAEDETGPALLQTPGLRTFWSTTLIDPERCRYQAVLLNPELALGTLELELEQQRDGTVARLSLSYTVLSEAGSALFDAQITHRLGRLLERFGRTLGRSMTVAPPAVSATQPARRQGVAHEVVINGDVDQCFALACPVAELRWVDDWRFDLIYSDSGINETGCVFVEASTGLAVLRCADASTYWYSTRFDVQRHRFEAIWITRDLSIARWEVGMTDLGQGQTRVNWSLVYTGLSPRGDRIISEPGLEQRAENVLRYLATSLKHYVETGTMYRLSSHRKLRIAVSLIGAALGRHFRRRA